jgi:three-Cys-motif partner protein
MLKLEQPADDGFTIPEVQWWSREKHHFLRRYIDAFVTAMRGKQWSGLHYVDLFAGAGIERLKETGELEWGSPLIAAQAQFDQLHLCELNKARHKALRARVQRLRPESSDQVLHGDANEQIRPIVNSIPDRALTLAFLDPYGLHLGYATLSELSRIRSDLIIFFPDRLDANRNWHAYYWENPDSNLDGVLGADAN